MRGDWNCCAMLQVTTLVEHIEKLCGMKFSSCVDKTFSCWAESTRRVDSCRRVEIANAISRHRNKNVSQPDKDKGMCACVRACV